MQFRKVEMSNAYPWPALSTHTITGVVAILTAAINACRGPWMSGAFGRELSEALVFFVPAHVHNAPVVEWRVA